MYDRMTFQCSFHGRAHLHVGQTVYSYIVNSHGCANALKDMLYLEKYCLHWLEVLHAFEA